MKTIKLNKSKEYQIGNVRVDKVLFDKIEELAKSNNTSNQTIIRAILENCIDDIKIIN